MNAPEESRRFERYSRYTEKPFNYPPAECGVEAWRADGYREFSRRALLGHGSGRFEECRAELFRWTVQRRAGVRVFPDSAACLPGVTILLSWGVGPFRIDAPCRIVRVVDESRRAGFTYGTIKGHPESGEESFVVELDDAQRVWLTIRAYSRPARWYSKFAHPVAHLVQDMITRRYLRSL